MIDKNEVLKQYNQAINDINTQESLKHFLRVMALHPYTDFANCALLMQRKTLPSVYCVPGAHQNGIVIQGFTYNPQSSNLGYGSITYLHKKGPSFNRNKIEIDYDFCSKTHNDNDVVIKDDDLYATIYYPADWDESRKAEALIEIIYDMFSTSTDQAVRNCVIFMSMTYAGYNAYLPTSTYNNITDSGKIDPRIPLTYISAHYQSLHRRLYGAVLTPLEIGFTKDYQSYASIDNPLLVPYKDAFEHLFKDRYMDLFGLNISYYPLLSFDHLLN